MPKSDSSLIHYVAARYQGQNIAAARKAAGFTQKTAAEQLGVKWMVLKSWEQGRRLSPVELRQKIVELWKASPEKLGLDPEGHCPCCGVKKR